MDIMDRLVKGFDLLETFFWGIGSLDFTGVIAELHRKLCSVPGAT